MDDVVTLITLVCTKKEKVQVNFDILLLETKTSGLLCISLRHYTAYGQLESELAALHIGLQL